MYVHYAAKDDLKRADGDETLMHETRKNAVKGFIHHEIEHMLETDENVEGWNETRTSVQQYPEQAALYLYKTEHSIDVAWDTRVDERGFANLYGKTNELEDRASISEYLLSRNEKTRELLEKAKRDTVLQNKIAFMKQLYFTQSLGLMNEAYWRLSDDISTSTDILADFLQIQGEVLSSMDDANLLQQLQKGIGDTANSEVAAKWRNELRLWLDRKSK